MQRGAVWKLTSPLLGMCDVEDNVSSYGRTLVTLPANSRLKVLNASPENAFVEAVWEGRHVLVFRIDLEKRGKEIVNG